LTKSIFIHRSVLEQSGIETIGEGDVIVCDIAPVPKGKLVAIAIHEVIKASSAEHSEAAGAMKIEGVIGFWNSVKGYGFIKSSDLPEDAYVSSRSSDGKFAAQLRQGAKVTATVARQRFGKLAVTNIERVDN
jgi:cold shock CspA family protein